MKTIVYDRHAKRRMKERGVSEEEAKLAIETPDYSEPSVKGRMNAFKFINNRHLRVTFQDEPGRRLVITITIRKKPFKEH